MRRLVVGALSALSALAALLLLAGPASAHVTVSAPGAAAGGYAVVTFRVPTESDTASTVGLKVRLPAFKSVLVQPQAGWTFKTVKSGDTVTEVDWTATSGAIRPGEFGQFRLSVGPLPQALSVRFKAIQVYSDGTTVAWTDVPAPGSTAEPAHPAPMLTLSPADPTPDRASGSTDDTVPLVLASIALAVACAALALVLLRRRRTP